MDGYNKNADGGKFVTYERLRAMGTNGFQEPATDFQDGKIIGTKRLFTDGKFKMPDGKAKFAAAQWRGLEAPGKQAEKDKFRFLINNGRSNQVWQSVYLDQHNEFVWDRMPFAYIQMNPQDVAELKLNPGDLVEVYNDNGSTQAMVWPTPIRATQPDLHAVRLPHRRGRQRSQQGRQRADHPELQADLGQHPKVGRRAAGHTPSVVQVGGVQSRKLTITGTKGKLARVAGRAGRRSGWHAPSFRPGRQQHRDREAHR